VTPLEVVDRRRGGDVWVAAGRALLAVLLVVGGVRCWPSSVVSVVVLRLDEQGIWIHLAPEVHETEWQLLPWPDVEAVAHARLSGGREMLRFLPLDPAKNPLRVAFHRQPEGGLAPALDWIRQEQPHVDVRDAATENP